MLTCLGISGRLRRQQRLNLRFSRGSSSHSVTSSLIMQLKELDDEDTPSSSASLFSTDSNDVTLSAVGRTVLRSPISGDLQSSSRPVTPEDSPQHERDDNVPTWVDTSRFEETSVVLLHIVAQVTQSLFSGQFELRRAGQMVLPVLSETIRWYNIKLQSAVWAEAMHCFHERCVFCLKADVGVMSADDHAGRGTRLS